MIILIFNLFIYWMKLQFIVNFFQFNKEKVEKKNLYVEKSI